VNENHRRCRSCGAPVVWVWSSAGKAMPLDAVPVPDGMFQLVDGRAWTVRSDLQPGPRYTSHFATCPQAYDWRRRSR
jgi:hypothetical protein